MKKITLFFIACSIAVSGLYAQEPLKLADFEDASTFFTTQTTNVTMSLAVNPDKSGENLSNNVLQINGAAARASWEALYTPGNKTTFAWQINSTTGYRYLHYKVWKDFTSKMLASFYHDHDNNGTLTEAYANEYLNTKTGEWEYVVADLLTYDSDGLTWHINGSFGTYYRMNFNMTKSSDGKAGQAYVAYLDDIYLSNSAQKILNTTTGTNSIGTNKNVTVFRLDGNTVQIYINPELKGCPKLDVYNVQGQLIRTIGNEQTIAKTFDVSFPAGNLYILRVSDEQGVYSVKF